MERKVVISFCGAIIMVIIGLICALYLHEMGHMLTAMIILHIPMCKIHIGIESYVNLPVSGESDIVLGLISIGSFILPQLFYWILLPIKNIYICTFRICMSFNHYFHLSASVYILIVGSAHPDQWDILRFQNYLHIKSSIIILFFLVLLIFNFILEYKIGSFIWMVNYHSEKLDS